ncbi:hypothetical protein ACOSOMT5_P3099 [Acidiphilium sp. MT5]
MTNQSAPNRITKASLALGSAVAIVGLVATLPAHAATAPNPCSGKSTTSKSVGKMDNMKSSHAAMSKPDKKMDTMKSTHMAMSKKKTKSSNCAACSGK